MSKRAHNLNHFDTSVEARGRISTLVLKFFSRVFQAFLSLIFALVLIGQNFFALKGCFRVYIGIAIRDVCWLKSGLRLASVMDIALFLA